MPGHNLNLLCIDGCGVKGLSALYILQKLMYLLPESETDEPLKPYDVFDLIGGTSTGGWITIILGRLRMSLDECIDAFMLLQDLMFAERGLASPAANYTSKILEDGFKTILCR